MGMTTEGKGGNLQGCRWRLLWVLSQGEGQSFQDSALTAAEAGLSALRDSTANLCPKWGICEIGVTMRIVWFYFMFQFQSVIFYICDFL